MTGTDPDLARIVLTVRSCPLVAGVHAGRRGAIITMTRHGRLVGVFLHGAVLIVGVIAYPEATDTEVIAEVHAAVAPQVPHLLVVVIPIERLRRVSGRPPHSGTTRHRPLIPPTIARLAVRTWTRFLQLVALTGLGTVILAALVGAALLTVFQFAGG